MSGKEKDVVSDIEHDDEPSDQFIYVVGGRELRDGQVALAEVHPNHPRYDSKNPDKASENQAYVVKGSEKSGGAWVARTPLVHQKLSRGFLRQVNPPAGAGPMPKRSKPTESSQRVERFRQEHTPDGPSPVTTGTDQAAIDKAVKDALAKQAADHEAEVKALQESHNAELDELTGPGASAEAEAMAAAANDTRTDAEKKADAKAKADAEKAKN